MPSFVWFLSSTPKTRTLAESLLAASGATIQRGGEQAFYHTGEDFIRIPEQPTEPWMPVNRGYEVEIGDWPDDYSCTGVLYTFTKALSRPIKPMGEWNTLEITIDGPRTIVYLNNVKVTDFAEGDPVPDKHPGSIDPDRGPRPDSGYVGLQNHPGSEVYFKEVSLTPLP